MLTIRAVACTSAILGVVALRGAIAQDDELANVLVETSHRAVVTVVDGLREIPVRKVCSQHGERPCDERDSPGLQRLDEAARTTDRHAILDPAQLAFGVVGSHVASWFNAFVACRRSTFRQFGVRWFDFGFGAVPSKVTNVLSV